eukprot:3690432-Pleurochrysis_carterae.AAC.1
MKQRKVNGRVGPAPPPNQTGSREHAASGVPVISKTAGNAAAGSERMPLAIPSRAISSKRRVAYVRLCAEAAISAVCGDDTNVPCTYNQ